MHAIRLYSFGPAENLRYESVPDPLPGPGEVRIAVHAVGVHFIETLFRQGIPIGPHPAPDLPTTFGREVAGVVESVGEGVGAGVLGSRVVTSQVTSGGYASLAVAPAAGLTVLPDGLEYDAAVAMQSTGATTLGLLEVAPVTASDVVLVMAAAGGIGTLLVQHARRVGATVVGAASGPAKAARVRSLGADLAVDYGTPGWTDVVRESVGDVTIVFDGVGGELGRAAFELLGGEAADRRGEGTFGPGAEGGRQVVFGQASGEWFHPEEDELKARGVTSYDGIAYLLGRQGGMDDLRDRALEAAANGELTPAVQSFPLERAAAAHAALESRNTMGKVILTP
ncbi:zinc-binding dehydrogenase [Nonomuraea sp. NPDC050680]|uniref:zinc-binding dehydrogenase n=1 Tax=Nonomuraea sp. NPDC050680 TaxID=3154630 RepID=UPI003406B29D